MVTNNRLAVARAAYCEVGNRCNGKLICYRDCLISLFPLSLFFSSSFRRRCADPASLPVLNCAEPESECSACLEPSPPVRGSEESWPDSGSCLSRVHFWARSLSPVVPLGGAEPLCFLHVCVCQCGSWCGILSAVCSCCGWVAKARYGRQLVIRLIMLPLSEVGLMWVLSARYNVVRRENLSWLNVLNVVRDVLHNASRAVSSVWCGRPILTPSRRAELRPFINRDRTDAIKSTNSNFALCPSEATACPMAHRAHQASIVCGAINRSYWHTCNKDNVGF